MITIPFYGLVVLPGVTFYFKKEFFEELNGELMPEEGEEVLFVMMKQDKDRKNLAKEDFYPIGVLGRISGVDSEQNVGVDARKKQTMSRKAKASLIRLVNLAMKQQMS